MNEITTMEDVMEVVRLLVETSPGVRNISHGDGTMSYTTLRDDSAAWWVLPFFRDTYELSYYQFTNMQGQTRRQYQIEENGKTIMDLMQYPEKESFAPRILHDDATVVVEKLADQYLEGYHFTWQHGDDDDE